jgi:hypothetical protein
MGVPVPAAKQLLQGSSSPLNLSHLLLVFRHWSHAEEREVSQDGGAAGQGVRASAAPFSIGRLGGMLVIVRYVRIGKGRVYRHGERIARVRREGRGRRQKNGPGCHAVRLGISVIRPWHAIDALSLVAGSPAAGTLYKIHFFIFVFHSKGKLNGNAQMPPLTIATRPPPSPSP